MTKKHLTPLEAWDDFYRNFKCEGKMPGELIVAHATANGKQFQPKSGKPKVLGPQRIRRLLHKYALGQYDFHDGSPYFTKPTKKKL